MLVDHAETAVQAEYRHRVTHHAKGRYGAATWIDCRTPFCSRARHYLLGEPNCRFCGGGMLARDCGCSKAVAARTEHTTAHEHAAASFCLHCGIRLDEGEGR